MASEDLLTQARERLVAAIAREGVSEKVLNAIATVKREHFVPRFRGTPSLRAISRTRGVREWSVEDAGVDPAIAAMVYDVDQALGIAEDEHGHTTSTASAPGLMASMLDVLDLDSSTRVLEIGTGSGYNAALLAEVIGDPARVTTIDIDGRLTRLARERLDAAGYRGVDVRTGDGTAAIDTPDKFDRLIATVGCADLAPAWFDQLVPGGFALVPVEHGGTHPLVRATFEPPRGALVSEIVGRSGFVAVQGRQAGGTSPWPFAGTTLPRRGLRTHRLPAQLASELRIEPGREARGGIARWDFSYYLALVDNRTSYVVTMADGTGSTAAFSGDEIWSSGPNGEVLATDLTAHAIEWIDLGSPGAEQFKSVWEPLDVAPSTSGEWTIDRVDYRQVVSLAN